MRIRLSTAALCLGVLLAGHSIAMARGGRSPVQSGWRPMGYPITGKVYMADCDAAAALFEVNKASWLAFCNAKLPERKVFTGIGLNKLDPSRLYFFFDYNPRVYYLSEGACYDNALGVTIATVGAPQSTPVTGDTSTVFPNTHSSLGVVCASKSGVRSADEPLLPGDFVKLPTVKAGQQLAFFLMAEMDSNHQPRHVYYNGSPYNEDGYQHLVAFFPDDSQFLIIGWEDMLNGGDKDCNDLLFAVDIGPDNAAALRNQLSLPK